MKAALLVYALAMIAANLLVARYGPAVTPINAFVLIGLDLTLRDWLHLRLSQRRMLGLIVIVGTLTWLLNPAAGRIAAASALSFTAAALVDWAVFRGVGGSWLRRANLSNLAGAAVDSVLFPTLAFGALLPSVVLLQFLAKVAGGFVWALLLNRFAAQWLAPASRSDG